MDRSRSLIKDIKELPFYFIYCSTFTLFLLFSYTYWIKMIFFKKSLMKISILIIAIWVMPATSNEGIDRLRGID